MITKTYYWNAKPNFGDQLTPILLKHFSNIDPVWSAPADSEIVVCGSVLDVLPLGWSGVIAGAGRLHPQSPSLGVPLTLGVRGVLTLRSLGLTDSGIVLGDPGLLASELVNPEPRKYKLGVCPHWSDLELFPREWARSRRGGDATPILIDPAGDPLDVVAKIGSCDKVVGSSLHSITVADAFGIPRRAERFPAMDSPSEGTDLKFRDYASAIGQPIEFGKLQPPSRERVEATQHDLFEMFARIPSALL